MPELTDELGAELVAIAAVEAVAVQDVAALDLLVGTADQGTVRELALLAFGFALASVGPEELPDVAPAELARALTDDVLGQLATYRRVALTRLHANPPKGGDHA